MTDIQPITSRNLPPEPLPLAELPQLYQERIGPLIQDVYEVANKGINVTHIAEHLNITFHTFDSYRVLCLEFYNAIQKGHADYRIRLANRIEDKITQGDTGVIIFAAKQRHTLDWSDQRRVEHSGDIEVKFKTTVMDADQPIDITPNDDSE